MSEKMTFDVDPGLTVTIEAGRIRWSGDGLLDTDRVRRRVEKRLRDFREYVERPLDRILDHLAIPEAIDGQIESHAQRRR